MTKLFIDTSFIIPIFKKNDSSRPIIEKNKNILFDNECYISNGVLNEVVTVVMMKTKSIELTQKAYYFLKDNFKLINEYDIEKFNDRVFSLFKKYNTNTYKTSYIDCSTIIIAKTYDMNYVVSLDQYFNKFEEIKLLKLK